MPMPDSQTLAKLAFEKVVKARGHIAVALDLLGDEKKSGPYQCRTIDPMQIQHAVAELRAAFNLI